MSFYNVTVLSGIFKNLDIMSMLLYLFNVSISASFLALAVLLFRLIFKKSPKWLIVSLWALVAIRLIFPFSIESNLSLNPNAEVIPQAILNIDPNKVPDASFGLIENPVYSGLVNSTVVVDNVNSFQFDVMYASFVWLFGMGALLLYAIISYVRLHRIVKAAVPFKENVWLCDEVKSPFILGVFKPKIYLPSDMDKETAELVLKHEKAHLKRKDHLWKPLGFVLLSVYWFNPVLWLSYILLCRDIELACDEKVIRDMENSDKRAYSEALVSCSTPQKLISACPVAFGEVGVKKRIKNVLNYKKPAFWLILVAVVVSVVLAVCFMTDPKSKNGDYDFIRGVDEISELSFNMKDIALSAHTYTVYEGMSTTDNYFDSKIEDAFSYSEVSSFLNHLTLGEMGDGAVNPMHEPQVNAVIKIQTNDLDPISIIFHDNYRKMYMVRGNESYSVRSKDYAVIGDNARQFFYEKPYRNHSLVWEYNLASSAWGHGHINVYVDKKYEISGEVKGEGVIERITEEEKGLEGISWQPYVEENLTEYKIEIPVNRDGKDYIFEFVMTKAGKNGIASYYTLRADELVIASYPDGFSFELSLPESGESEEGATANVASADACTYKSGTGVYEFDNQSVYWSYSPYASATGWNITEFYLPEGSEIKSAEASNGHIWIDNRYYSEPDGEKVVKWSPDLYEDDTSPDETDIDIKAVNNGKESEFRLRVTRISGSDEIAHATSTFKITPVDCKLTEEGWAIYHLEEK